MTRPDAGSARRQFVVGVTALAAVYLVVFGPGVLTSIRVVAGSAAPHASSAWMDRVAALEWDVFTTMVVLVVVVRWLPRHAPLVTRHMHLGRQSTGAVPGGVPGGVLGATAVYVTVALVSGWAGDQAVAGAHLARATYTQLGDGTGSFLIAGAAATAAGFTEEITLVALAAAVVAQLCAEGGRASRRPVALTIGVLITLRWLVHLYYLWGSVFVLVWVPGAYLLYRWAGSVWPLVIGHWCYDWLELAEHSYPGQSRQIQATVWLLTAAGAIVVVIGVRRAIAARSRDDEQPTTSMIAARSEF